MKSNLPVSRWHSITSGSDELAIIVDWAFAYMPRSGDARHDIAVWPRDLTGGSVYLRLSTRSIDQVPREVNSLLTNSVIGGAYWQKSQHRNAKSPSPNGVLASQAIEAAARLGDDKRNVAILAVTSTDRLNAGWLGSVLGHGTVALGVEHFGQTGMVVDLHRHFEIDAPAIEQACRAFMAGTR